MSSFLLRKQLHKISNRKYLVLAFSSESYDIDYEPVEITAGYARRPGIEKYKYFFFLGLYSYFCSKVLKRNYGGKGAKRLSNTFRKI